MRKLLLFLLLALIFIALTGCIQKSSSNDLMYETEVIDDISVDVPEGNEGGAVNFSINKEQITAMVTLLKDIEVEELSAELEKEIFKNAKAWSQNVKYQIALVNTKEAISSVDPNAAFKGVVTILSDGYILFLDPKTLSGKNGTVKTISYISTDKQTEIIAQITKIVEESKEEYYE